MCSWRRELASRLLQILGSGSPHFLDVVENREPRNHCHLHRLGVDFRDINSCILRSRRGKSFIDLSLAYKSYINHNIANSTYVRVQLSNIEYSMIFSSFC